MKMISIVVLFCVLGVSVAQTVTIDPVGSVTVVEGNNLTITCTDGVNVGNRFTLRENGVRLTGDDTPPNEVNGLVRIFQLPVDRAKNGNTYKCEELVDGMTSAVLNVTVAYPPQFSSSNTTATPTEGGQLTHSYSIDANPPPNIILTRSGTPVTDARVTVTTTSLTIADVTRGDSGEYQITASTVAGSATFTLTVDVYYPPEFIVPSQNVNFNATGSEVFTFDCTPSGGNPAVYSYTFNKNCILTTEGVSGSVLTMNPVVRSSRGVYTCTANNTAGTAVVTRNLFVNVPPTMPLNPRVVDFMPFSATLQWGPPSDNGGSSLPLTYTVTLTNTSTSLPFSNITATSLLLPNLQHSTQYSWSVQAINEYGSSPPAEGTFTTPDSVPIIDSVSAMALNLSAFQVNITLLTDGGQRVTLYTVEIRGVNYTGIVESSDQSWVSVLVNQLDQNFTKGETHTVKVFATNSVGTSNPRSTLLQVPFPPSIAAPPTELSTTNIPVCCAGVELNLANPDDPIDVRVFVNGTPHPPNQVTKNSSFLYIMGLQAGTEYSLNITLSNIFGTVWVNTTARPLLGNASTPEVTITPTAGGLTVQLTVMYPGTREDTLQYSISTSSSPLSRRQTGQQPLPLTDLTTPTSGSVKVALGLVTYSVTVTVTNQHGSTMSVPQQVTIPGSCPGSTDQTPAVVAVSAVLAIVILLLAMAILTIILLYTRIQKLSSMLKAVKDPNYHYAGVEMESHGLPNSKSTTEPQYEECGGGVTSSNVAMEENPAYQSVDLAAAKP